MNLPAEVFGDVIVVHTPEELANEAAEGLLPYLTSLEQRNVVLDIDATEFIDSAGLTGLLDAQDVLREAGGNVKITTTNEINRQILEITRIDAHLEIFDSVIDAVKSYR